MTKIERKPDGKKEAILFDGYENMRGSKYLHNLVKETKNFMLIKQNSTTTQIGSFGTDYFSPEYEIYEKINELELGNRVYRKEYTKGETKEATDEALFTLQKLQMKFEIDHELKDRNKELEEINSKLEKEKDSLKVENEELEEKLDTIKSAIEIIKEK